MLRIALLAVVLALLTYALVRAALGDYWTLLTTAVIGFVLALLQRGIGRLRRNVDAATG